MVVAPTFDRALRQVVLDGRVRQAQAVGSLLLRPAAEPGVPWLRQLALLGVDNAASADVVSASIVATFGSFGAPAARGSIGGWRRVMLRSILTLTTAAAALGAAGYELGYKPWRGRWLANPEERARALPGDALVPDADFNQTMAITTDAPPSAVWPWLLQQGYGRAGWYSYDAIDMLGNSARELRPEFQHLAAGETIPFAPGMGFRVDVLEPQHALVLYADSEIASAPKDASAGAEGAGMKLAGLLSDANASAFRMTWAFVLEPVGAGRTRLLERFRTRATAGPASVFVRPIVDVGHFLMTRKHLLGIKERAELTAAGGMSTDVLEAASEAASVAPETLEPVAVGAA